MEYTIPGHKLVAAVGYAKMRRYVYTTDPVIITDRAEIARIQAECHYQPPKMQLGDNTNIGGYFDL